MLTVIHFTTLILLCRYSKSLYPVCWFLPYHYIVRLFANEADDDIVYAYILVTMKILYAKVYVSTGDHDP